MRSALPMDDCPPSPATALDTAVDWDAVLARACKRAETDCAICLAELLRQPQQHQQGVTVLSCSHVFHVACVTAFERFETGRGGAAFCPVCREPYQRRCFAASVTDC